jgi:hypothetical protein
LKKNKKHLICNTKAHAYEKKGINITSPNILARYMKIDDQELQRFINATVLWKGSYNYIYLKFRLGCKSDKCGVWVMVFNATFNNISAISW